MSYRPLHGDRSTDHPTRETSDHANLDPRKHPKHPKALGETRRASPPERRSDRAA
jgi:hypothetical protein